MWNTPLMFPGCMMSTLRTEETTFQVGYRHWYVAQTTAHEVKDGKYEYEFEFR